MELLKDQTFSSGFILSGFASNVPEPYIGEYRFGGSGLPQWVLCQWGSNHLITPRTECRREGKYRELQTEAKNVCVLPGEGKFRMDVTASREYVHARADGEAWPHLLIDQFLDDRKVSLGTLEKLVFRLHFTIDECVNRMKAGEYDEKLHTAQFQWYCTLRNENPASPDFGQVIWFGLQFFDARLPKPGGSIRIDGGKEDSTGYPIYCVEYDKFMPEPVVFGRKYTVCMDLLPEVRCAIEKVRDFSGAERFHHTTLGDLCMTSMNLGWELPGTYDVRSSFSGLSLSFKTKESSAA